jgi:metal-responsive CopG/Arc/MetJ family transcriptional regulator
MLAEIPHQILIIDKKYNFCYTYDMKTAVSLPDKLFRQAEKTASKLGIPRSQLFAQALEEFIQHHRSDYVTEKLNKIYSDEDSKIDSTLIKLQEKILLNEGEGESW